MTDTASPDLAAPTGAPPVHRLFIGGEWAECVSGRMFESVNPADTRDVIGHFQAADAADAAQAIRAAEVAYPGWRATPAPKRGEILYRFGALMAEHKERLARAMTREMGKVLAEARGDVQEGIDIAYLMAGEGRRLFGDTTPSELPDKWAMSVREPLGVAGIITPWNFPMAIPCWKMMPALVTGNTVVLKPSSDTPHCATLLVELMAEAGFPPGTVNLVTGAGAEVGDALVANPDVEHHQLHRQHGDRQAHRRDRRPSAQAGQPRARRQERDRGPGRRRPRPGRRRDRLVGVRDDRPALHGLLAGHRRGRRRRVRCSSASSRRARALRLGSGLDPATDVGPLVNGAALRQGPRRTSMSDRRDARPGHRRRPGERRGPRTRPLLRPDDLRRGQADGPDRPGGDLRAGPVGHPVPDYPAAVTALNQSRYGLSSAIFTRDVNPAFRAMRDFETGIVYVNAGTIGAETHLPFGGTKQTGNGHREAGHAALETYTEWKSIYVDFSGRLQRAQIDNQPD